MKQFLVLKSFMYEDNKGFPDQGAEPIQDFDTRDEALAFISEQKSPNDFYIDDQKSDTVFDNDQRLLEEDEVCFDPDEDDDEWDDQDDDNYDDEDEDF